MASIQPKRIWSAPRHPDAQLFRLVKEFEGGSAEQRAIEDEDDGVDYLEDPKYVALSAAVDATAAKIIAHKTATIDGLRSKARAVLLASSNDQVDLNDDPVIPALNIASSLVRDLLAMKEDVS